MNETQILSMLQLVRDTINSAADRIDSKSGMMPTKAEVSAVNALRKSEKMLFDVSKSIRAIESNHEQSSR